MKRTGEGVVVSTSSANGEKAQQKPMSHEQVNYLLRSLGVPESHIVIIGHDYFESVALLKKVLFGVFLCETLLMRLECYVPFSKVCVLKIM